MCAPDYVVVLLQHRLPRANRRYVTQITTWHERSGERQGACEIGDADWRRDTFSGHKEGSRGGPLFFGRSMSPVAFHRFSSCSPWSSVEALSL